MSTITTETHTPVPGNNMLQRDREQAHLLHEPAHIYTSIDPITGRLTLFAFVIDVFRDFGRVQMVS